MKYKVKKQSIYLYDNPESQRIQLFYYVVQVGLARKITVKVKRMFHREQLETCIALPKYLITNEDLSDVCTPVPIEMCDSLVQIVY